MKWNIYNLFEHLPSHPGHIVRTHRCTAIGLYRTVSRGKLTPEQYHSVQYWVHCGVEVALLALGTDTNCTAGGERLFWKGWGDVESEM